LLELKQGDPLHEDFQEVRRAAERAAGLTRQLLAFSRKQVLQPEVLDLNAVVASTEKMLRRLIRESVALVVAPGQDLGRVRADPGQVEQVLMNLAVNARDAMPHGGTLTITTANVELDEVYAAGHPTVQPGPYVGLSVRDTGVGMNAATLQRIFEPFFTTKEEGTGLGLSTVYGIVQQSGGHISVDSEPGVGTTFKIHLPRVEGVVRAGPPAPTAISGRGTETILIVEGDAALRRMSGRLLRLSGYTVLAAGDGAEALALLKGHVGPVSLVLTDMIMPGMSGRELATALQGLRPQMKVIFTSGYTDDVLQQSGQFDAGAHFIGRPHTAMQLSNKVREVLDS
jgi:CheY-like chemotaxis protein